MNRQPAVDHPRPMVPRSVAGSAAAVGMREALCEQASFQVPQIPKPVTGKASLQVACQNFQGAACPTGLERVRSSLVLEWDPTTLSLGRSEAGRATKGFERETAVYAVTADGRRSPVDG